MKKEAPEIFVRIDRERISRALHDSVIQLLRASLFKVEYLKRKPENLNTELILLEGMLSKSMAELRRIIQELNSSKADTLGLVPALCYYLEKLKEESGIEFVFDCPLEKDFAFPDASELCWAVLEALNNVRQHSKAGNVFLGITRVNGKKLQVKIKDDGLGFDVKNNTNFKMNYGLKNIRDRIKKIGGVMDLRSKKGRGTEVSFIIPLNPLPFVGRDREE